MPNQLLATARYASVLEAANASRKMAASLANPTCGRADADMAIRDDLRADTDSDLGTIINSGSIMDSA